MIVSQLDPSVSKIILSSKKRSGQVDKMTVFCTRGYRFDFWSRRIMFIENFQPSIEEESSYPHSLVVELVQLKIQF